MEQVDSKSFTHEKKVQSPVTLTLVMMIARYCFIRMTDN
jgi:hypothetical protein